MVCIYCGSETQVANSRAQKRSNQVWRRRRCNACLAVFTSLEAADLASSLSFRTSHNKLVPFSRDTLFVSLYDSLRHRPSALADATALTNTILGNVIPQAEQSVITRYTLIKVASESLEHFDKPAAVHYTAFHPVN